MLSKLFPKKEEINAVKNLFSNKDKAHAIIDAAEATSLRLSPQLKNELASFGLSSAQQFRQLDVDRLQDLLRCCSKALKVFENQLKIIVDGYDEIERYADKWKDKSGDLFAAFNNMIGDRVAKKKTGAEVERLNIQTERTLEALNEELASVESVLGVIPPKYRMSIILDQMCEYLEDGEVDSWEGCIKTFKDDSHKMRENAYFNSMLDMQANLVQLTASIEQNTAATARNTALTAFFSGITAWNTP